MKIGILTGGGDCPGLNAVIRAVVRAAGLEEWQVIGFLNGGSFIYTALFGFIISRAVGFQDETDSLIVMILYIIFILLFIWY